MPRGFRSSFRDWASEETDHPREVIEAALAHAFGIRVERRRPFKPVRAPTVLMGDWFTYLSGLVRKAG